MSPGSANPSGPEISFSGRQDIERIPLLEEMLKDLSMNSLMRIILKPEYGMSTAYVVFDRNTSYGQKVDRSFPEVLGKYIGYAWGAHRSPKDLPILKLGLFGTCKVEIPFESIQRLEVYGSNVQKTYLANS